MWFALRPARFPVTVVKYWEDLPDVVGGLKFDRPLFEMSLSSIFGG